MRRWILAAILSGVVVGAAAMAAMAALTVARKSGTCKVQQAGAFDDEKHFKVTLGNQLRARCAFYVDEFFGKRIINARAAVLNPTDKPMFFEYHVAFFDADGQLLGCTSQGQFSDDGLQPEKELTLGSCLVQMPEEAIKKVASYQVVLYESDAPIGKIPEKK